MGLFKSAVLSRLPKPKLIRAPAAVVAPVPPLVRPTTPVTFSAVMAAFANGTEAIGSFESSSN